MTVFEKLLHIVRGLNKRFPNGNEPFQIITRLAEECGELAEQVNHFEHTGVKEDKHGAPDRRQLAKEVQDVIRCALAVAVYYGVENELEQGIKNAYTRMQAEGLIDTTD